MSDLRVARRYALALYELAQEQKILDSVLSDVRVLQTALENSPEFRAFIQNPVIAIDEKKTFLSSVFENRIHPLVLNFLFYLIKKMRLDIARDIFNAFLNIHLEMTNTIKVDLQSERVLTPQQTEQLLSRLEEYSGKSVQLKAEVDPQLVGGFKVRMGDQVFDASLAAQLKRFYDQAVLTV